jgi:hypothetical protein
MATVSVSTLIEADQHTVFDAFTDFASSLRHIPAVTNIEMLTHGQISTGTRFKQTRMILGHEVIEEFRVTALAPGRGYDLICESFGSEYRERFRFGHEGDGTRVKMEFIERAKSRSAKLMTPVRWLMKGILRKNLEADLNWIKRWIERTRKEALRNGVLRRGVH